MDATLFLSGIAVGLTVAAPIGPMGILCVERTLAFGATAGMITGLGAATVHALYGTVAVLGFDAISRELPRHGLALSLAGAVILVYFAWSCLRRSAPQLGAMRLRPPGLAKTYGSAVVMGMGNPYTILLFTAAVPVLVPSLERQGAAFLVLGVFAGSILWWFLLSMVSFSVRERLNSIWLCRVSRISGIALMIAAISLVLRAIHFA